MIVYACINPHGSSDLKLTFRRVDNSESSRNGDYVYDFPLAYSIFSQADTLTVHQDGKHKQTPST